ncbi:hypothetical protein M6B38_307345 [Iris pallida]|uniref:Uncharacterized protein n=1 Tax=Iris pallida TaxID=29817 RepID=A0AAX6HKC2_IRIPA|nr:hypothetical protein M6B38_307345 [Iris pallida]
MVIDLFTSDSSLIFSHFAVIFFFPFFYFFYFCCCYFPFLFIFLLKK